MEFGKGVINPEAVEKGLKLGAKEIWLPTQSAKRHLEQLGGDPKKGIEFVKDGKVIPELLDVFKLVKDFDVALGTAHVSPYEAFVVIEAARNAGVNKLIVTHPEWWVVDMSVEDQIRAVKDYDVILERCYAQNMGGGKHKSNLADNLAIIKEVGYKTKINTGLFCMVFAYAIGCFAMGLKTTERWKNFPVPCFIAAVSSRDFCHMRFLQ